MPRSCQQSPEAFVPSGIFHLPALSAVRVLRMQPSFERDPFTLCGPHAVQGVAAPLAAALATDELYIVTTKQVRGQQCIAETALASSQLLHQESCIDETQSSLREVPASSHESRCIKRLSYRFGAPLLTNMTQPSSHFQYSRKAKPYVGHVLAVREAHIHPQTHTHGKYTHRKCLSYLSKR